MTSGVVTSEVWRFEVEACDEPANACEPEVWLFRSLLRSIGEAGALIDPLGALLKTEGLVLASPMTPFEVPEFGKAGWEPDRDMPEGEEGADGGEDQRVPSTNSIMSPFRAPLGCDALASAKVLRLRIFGS